MPLLDSNLWAGTDPRMQQGMGQFPGMMPQGGVPQLPPSLAAQISQRGATRMSPQGNPLMAATMAQPSNAMSMMPPFQPSALPKPSEFWEQRYQPNEGQLSRSLAGAMSQEAGVGMPGQLPQVGGPQIPNNMQGMGFGANAPQVTAIKPPAIPGAMGPDGNPMNDPNGPTKLKNQLFGAYMNLYPEGNI